MSQSRQPKSFLFRFWILFSFRSCPLSFDWIFPVLSIWKGGYLEFDQDCYSRCAQQRVVALPASSLCWKGGVTLGPATRHTDHNTQVDMPASYPSVTIFGLNFSFNDRFYISAPSSVGLTDLFLLHPQSPNTPNFCKIDLSRNSFDLYPSVDGPGPG